MIARVEDRKKIIIEMDIPSLDTIQPSSSGESLLIIPYQKWVRIGGSPFMLNIQVIAPKGWNLPEISDDQRFDDLSFQDWKKEYGGTK